MFNDYRKDWIYRIYRFIWITGNHVSRWGGRRLMKRAYKLVGQGELS